jgi:hypothetical protein
MAYIAIRRMLNLCGSAVWRRFHATGGFETLNEVLQTLPYQFGDDANLRRLQTRAGE